MTFLKQIFGFKKSPPENPRKASQPGAFIDSLDPALGSLVQERNATERVDPEKLLALLAGRAHMVREDINRNELKQLQEKCRDPRYIPELFLVLTLLTAWPDEKIKDVCSTLLARYAPQRNKEADLRTMIRSLVGAILRGEESWTRQAATDTIRQIGAVPAAKDLVRQALARRDLGPKTRASLEQLLSEPSPVPDRPAHTPRPDTSTPVCSKCGMKHDLGRNSFMVSPRQASSALTERGTLVFELGGVSRNYLVAELRSFQSAAYKRLWT